MARTRRRESGPHGEEVNYTELLPGISYYITKWGPRGEFWGRAKGVNFQRIETYDGNPYAYTEDGEEKTRRLGLAAQFVHEGDPLVTFKEIVPLNEYHKKRCGICSMTQLKPYNGGQVQNVGFKFHNVGSIKHITPLVVKKMVEDNPTRTELPDEIWRKIANYGGKRNKKKRRKTRRKRKSGGGVSARNQDDARAGGSRRRQATRTKRRRSRKRHSRRKRGGSSLNSSLAAISAKTRASNTSTAHHAAITGASL